MDENNNAIVTDDGTLEETVAPATEEQPETPAEMTPEEKAAAENEARCEEFLAEERFSFTYMLRFKDLLRHKMQFSLFDPIQGLPFWISLILSIVYLVAAWSTMTQQTRTIIIVVVVFLIWFVPVRAVQNAARNAAYLRKNCSPTEYHICEKGIVVCQDELRSAMAFGKFRRLKVNRNWLYAQVFLNSGFIFPKDLVGERYEELRAFLSSHIGKKK